MAELANDFDFDFDFEVPARSAKSVFVALAASHRFSYERILDALSRDKLKAIFWAGGLDDSGKVKAGIVDRILGRRDHIQQLRQAAGRAAASSRRGQHEGWNAGGVPRNSLQIRTKFSLAEALSCTGLEIEPSAGIPAVVRSGTPVKVTNRAREEVKE